MFAGRQHGVVTRGQLLEAGFTRHQIQRRIDAGLLVPIHPGVYFVAHATSPLAHECAAVLACRPRALLGGRTAGRVYGWPVEDSEGIDLIVVGRRIRPRSGIRVRCIGHLDLRDLQRHEGIPIASPSLTLLELAGDAEPGELAGAINEARVQRAITDAQLYTALERYPKRRGARALRALLESERGPRITRSEAERRALAVMRRFGIEPDASDVQIGPYRADFWFERERLAVEIDGYRYHSTPKRFVDDRRRAGYLAAHDVATFPLTWRDFGSGAREAMQLLAAALAGRRERR